MLDLDYHLEGNNSTYYKDDDDGDDKRENKRKKIRKITVEHLSAT